MQMNEAMNNVVGRRYPKGKIFASSGSLLYRVASVAGQHTKGADKYRSEICGKLGMTMSTQQQNFWNQRPKKTSDAEYKRKLTRKRKRK